jgi:tetratricopeptide (TPR) repeat protein
VYRELTVKLCELHLRAREYKTAWQDYEEFLVVGGEKMPPAIWLDLCRVPEEQQDFERAVSEYERLAAAYPSERQSLLARLGAARICLKRLNRPQDALRLYEGASASAVPHLDLKLDIQSRIREARIAITPVKAFSAVGRPQGEGQTTPGQNNGESSVCRPRGRKVLAALGELRRIVVPDQDLATGLDEDEVAALSPQPFPARILSSAAMSWMMDAVAAGMIEATELTDLQPEILSPVPAPEEVQI